MSEPAEKITLEGMTDADYEKYLPKPVGYHILVMMPEVKETYGDSGIVKSQKEMHHDTILSMVGIVVAVGDQAYLDNDRFPLGPWCDEGDYVMFHMNTGTRFKVGGKEFRLMNDDSISAVVPNPSAIQRV